MWIKSQMDKLGKIFSFTILIIVLVLPMWLRQTCVEAGDVAPSGAYSSDSDTVLLLHMNESSWNGTPGEVIDSSRYGNHGTAGGDATTIANGKFGSGGTFDGTTGDYVVIGDYDSLDFGTGDFTIECWIKTTSTEVGYLVRKKAGDGGANPGWYLAISTVVSGRLYARMGDSVDSCPPAVSTTSINDNKWHHCAAVFDRDGNLQLFIDGNAEATTDISGYSGSVNNDVGLYIGCKGGAGGFYTGLIDEVRVSNKVRSSMK